MNLKQRILDNIKVTDSDCWEWQKSKTPTGYGRISVGHQKQDYAHRVSYRVFNGEIMKGMYVCHKCDNPSCVNPNHLFLGTQFDNMRDAAGKGRVRNQNPRGSKNGMAKLTEKDVLDIRASDTPTPLLAEKYGVTPTTIRYIKNKTTWSHVS